MGWRNLNKIPKQRQIRKPFLSVEVLVKWKFAKVDPEYYIACYNFDTEKWYCEAPDVSHSMNIYLSDYQYKYIV